MKDYKLSEIKAICEKQCNFCRNCEFRTICCQDFGFYGVAMPRHWQIDTEEQDDDGRKTF